MTDTQAFIAGVQLGLLLMISVGVWRLVFLQNRH